jgi:hypothetical protein
VVAAAFFATACVPKTNSLLGVLTFAVAGLGCSALLPQTISFGQKELTTIAASVAGGLIAFYQIGYARHNPDGTVSHVNTCESWFSLMKRSVFGAWHCISPEHLPKYASELEYRWNTRHVSDGERMAKFVPLISGKRLFYKQPAN